MNKPQKTEIFQDQIKTNAPLRQNGSAPKQRYKVKRAGLSVEEAGEYLGLSRTGAYDAVRAGTIPSIRIGRRWIVPIDKLQEKYALTTDPWGEDEIV